MGDFPKICVLSSGLDRIHTPCVDIFKSQIGISEIPIDYFGLFWSPCDRSKLAELVRGFRKVAIWTAPQRPFDNLPEFVKAPETNVKNFFSMCWGRWLLSQQMRESGLWSEYDVFLYTRPDVCFSTRINLLDFAEQSNFRKLYVPSCAHWRDGINDQVAWGGREIETYLDLFGDLSSYIREGVLLHPETMLKHHLLNKGIVVEQYPISNFIFRDEATIQVA